MDFLKYSLPYQNFNLEKKNESQYIWESQPPADISAKPPFKHVIFRDNTTNSQMQVQKPSPVVYDLTKVRQATSMAVQSKTEMWEKMAAPHPNLDLTVEGLTESGETEEGSAEPKCTKWTLSVNYKNCEKVLPTTNRYVILPGGMFARPRDLFVETIEDNTNGEKSEGCLAISLENLLNRYEALEQHYSVLKVENAKLREVIQEEHKSTCSSMIGGNSDDNDDCSRILKLDSNSPAKDKENIFVTSKNISDASLTEREKYRKLACLMKVTNETENLSDVNNEKESEEEEADEYKQSKTLTTSIIRKIEKLETQENSVSVDEQQLGKMKDEKKNINILDSTECVTNSTTTGKHSSSINKMSKNIMARYRSRIKTKSQIKRAIPSVH